MAMEPLATTVRVTFRDRENTPATSEFYLPNAGALFVNAHAIYLKARSVANAMAALSGSAYYKLQVLYAGRDSNITLAGEVERRGVFEFESLGGTGFVTAIPGFKNALLDSNRRSIAVEAGRRTQEVDDWLTAIFDGPPGFNNGLVNAAGLPLVACIAGTKAHTGSLLETRGRSG